MPCVYEFWPSAAMSVPETQSKQGFANRALPVMYLSTANSGSSSSVQHAGTGLKVYGAGEWHQHGVRGRRIWRKIHLAVGVATNTIVPATLTTTSEGDVSQVGPLLDQTTGLINTMMADSAFDGEPIY
jgi:hypothetical protein